MPKELMAFEKYIERVRVVSLVFNVTFYFKKSFRQFPSEINTCLEKFLRLCPEEQIKFYRTGNMEAHKPVTARSFSALNRMIDPTSKQSKLISIELKDGQEYRETPQHKFRVYGSGQNVSKGYRASVLSISLPAFWGLDRTDEIEQTVFTMGKRLPIISGHAGLAFECSPYLEELTNEHAWAKSMRHRGIDICLRPAKEAIAVQHDGLKTVSWITMLSTAMVNEIGLSQVSELRNHGIDVFEESDKIFIKSGETPEIGDRNKNIDDLVKYKKTYEALRPLILKAAERSPVITLPADAEEKTRRFFTRLEES